MSSRYPMIKTGNIPRAEDIKAVKSGLEIEKLKREIFRLEAIIYGLEESADDWELKCSDLEREIAEIREKTILDCRDELLDQLFPMTHSNGYVVIAVPKTTILALPALMKIQNKKR